MRVTLPYGRDEILEVDVPDENLLAVLTPPVVEPAREGAEAILDALRNPIGAGRLRDIAWKGARVAIVINDASRPNVEREVLPLVMSELRAAAIRDEDVVLVVGTGAHRPGTDREIAERIGALSGHVVVMNHDARQDRMVDLGVTSGGFPVEINAVVADADVRVAIGAVLPHPVAGYSAGPKAIAVGVASSRTIASTHTAQMLDHPKTGLGMLDGNPFYEAATEMARLARLDFIVNAVADESERIVDVASGDVELAHRSLIERTGHRVFLSYFPRPADIVVLSVGYPKDTNLYHISAEGICVVAGSALPTPCVKPGGTIVVASPMDEGIYNRVYYDWLTSSRNLDETIDRLRTEPIVSPGQHRAYGVARVLKDHEVIVAQSHLDPAVVRAAHMVPMGTVQEALDYALAKHGRGAEVLVVANSHRLVPTLEPG